MELKLRLWSRKKFFPGFDSDWYRNRLTNTRTVPGADMYSDHNLVLANIRIRLKKIKKAPVNKILDVEKLKEETVKEKFASKVNDLLKKNIRNMLP